MNKTEIRVDRYSSSGSRTCLVCEEKITDVTYMVRFKTEDNIGEIVDRAVDQITLHKKCATELVYLIGDCLTQR